MWFWSQKKQVKKLYDKWGIKGDGYEIFPVDIWSPGAALSIMLNRTFLLIEIKHMIYKALKKISIP